MAQLPISKPVGDLQADGSRSPNLFDDTLIVQYLLNRSPGPGKPNPPLSEDGAVTARVIAAIRDYESFRGAVDGRIDPGDSTMVALNAIPLSQFEGVTDIFERRSIILRPNPQWNFTRGDFKTMTDGGRSLTYDPSATWLPNNLKTRILTILNTILNPAQVPSNTWGVSTLDSYHWHLGFWSGANKPISQDSEDWLKLWFGDPNRFPPGGLKNELANLRVPFNPPAALNTSFPSDIAKYSAAHAAWLQTPGVKLLLNAYANLPEAVIIHHTFEEVSWRPNMLTEDPRRARMVGNSGAIQIPKYLSPAELNDASHFHRREFLCEGMLQINLLIDKSGVIHPILGLLQDLSVVTGLSSDVLQPPPNRFKDVRIPF